MDVKQTENASLLLIVLVLIWWTSNTVTSIASKRFMIDEQPKDKVGSETKSLKDFKWIDLTFLQFGISALLTFILMKISGFEKPLVSIYKSELPRMALLGHLFGHMAINASHAAISSSTTQMIKACEPIFTFLLLLFLNQRKYETLSCSLLLSLLMMSAGTCLFVAADSKYNIQGVIAAIVSNCSFATRNILIKGKGGSFKSCLIQYFYLSVHCFFYLLPFGIFRLPYMRKMQFNTFEDTMISAGSFFAYNVASINVLQAMSPIQHALLNLFKRVFVMLINILYFSTPIRLFSVVGFLALFTGLLMYIKIHHGLSVPKYASKSTKAILICSLLSFPIMSFQFFTSNPVNIEMIMQEHVKSLWVYDRSMPDQVLQNVKSWHKGFSNRSVHTYCGNFKCVKSFDGSNRTKASFLYINELVENTVFETWFRKHPLNKVLEHKYFEDHLQQVAALSLIWREGGSYIDPRLNLTKKILYNLNIKEPWIAVSSSNISPNIVGLFNFPSQHRFITVIGKVMMNQYKKDVSNMEKWPIKFDFQDISWNACILNREICVNIVRFDNKHHFIKESFQIESSFGTLSYDARVRVAAEANLGDEIQGFPGLQFVPYMNEFVETDQLDSTKGSGKNITTFFNAWWGSPSQHWPPPKNIDPVMLSLHLGNAIKPMISKHLAYLKEKSPIGCHDPATLEFLKQQGVEAFYSSCMTVMMKNPSEGANRTDNIYLVDINDTVKTLLPADIQQKGISLEHNMKGDARLNKFARFKSAYNLIEKYARAKLIVTQRIHSALPSVAMGTPVIFINSSSMPGGGGTKRKSSPRTEGFNQLFHMLDLYNMSSNDAKMWLEKFDWNNPRPLPSSSSLLKRLRATSWNVIRKKRKLHESALKFGVIPYFNSLPKDSTNQDLFHLIFTTRGGHSIHLFSGGKVSGKFNWRHWRCIESIFYHHPRGKVLVHSNTLPLDVFAVLKESGYDIEVRRYDIKDLVNGTPAEKFMNKTYEKVNNRSYWYSHETDLLRTAILYKMGGVYMDTDVILVRPIRELPINVVGYEKNGVLINGAFMYFEKNHPFLFDILNRFNSEYRSDAWAVVGPQLITKILHLNSSSHYNVTVFKEYAFYMFRYNYINDQCFQQTTGPTFVKNSKILNEKAFAVHLYSKFSAMKGLNKKLKEGTLCKKLLNSFCVLCDKQY